MSSTLVPTMPPPTPPTALYNNSHAPIDHPKTSTTHNTLTHQLPPHPSSHPTTADIVAALHASRPPPDLHLPPFRSTEPLKWHTEVVHLLTSSPYHTCIMSEDGASIDPHRAAAHPYVDADVLHQVRKIMCSPSRCPGLDPLRDLWPSLDPKQISQTNVFTLEPGGAHVRTEGCTR